MNFLYINGYPMLIYEYKFYVKQKMTILISIKNISFYTIQFVKDGQIIYERWGDPAAAIKDNLSSIIILSKISTIIYYKSLYHNHTCFQDMKLICY